MKKRCVLSLAGGICALLSSWVSNLAASEQPPIPVGTDAYRQWERWPYQRVGMRAYMRSTYDRQGGNEGPDASHFLYQLAEDNNVVLDLEGAGIITFARYNHWHGSPWRYVVDGTEHLVEETTTADPIHPAPDSVFIPGAPFPEPLAYTWAATKGADLIWTPIGFRDSFRLGYSRTHYGTGYFIYDQFVKGTPLSQPIESWDGLTPPDEEAMSVLKRVGTDLAPTTGVTKVEGEVALDKGATVFLPRIVPPGASMMRALEISAPRAEALALGKMRLRVTWDEEAQPSVDAPLELFFGAGTFYNRDGREFLVKALPVTVRFDADRVYLACYFPMPFFRSAKIELVGNEQRDLKAIRWSARYAPFDGSPANVGYFHATYRDHLHPEPGQDLVLLDTREAEGGGDWSGQLVGTAFTFSDRAVLGTLEGDPRFFFDDSQTPQVQGTGTEEWGGGGDYWGGLNMTLPLAGHPTGARNPRLAQSEDDKVEGAYRYLLADMMPFGKNALIRLEHGGMNQSTEHYRTVTCWYGRRGATLVKSDELKIGDPASEQAHRYSSPQASAPYEIHSRYEWGPDQVTPPADSPQAEPDDYAEYEFDAEAGKPYAIWLRGRNVDGGSQSDTSWLQFDDDIKTPKTDASYAAPNKGFGNWHDIAPVKVYAWSSALPKEPPRAVTFASSGKHRLRVQVRRSRHYLQTIWLSSTQKTLPAASVSPPSPNTDEIVIDASRPNVVKGKVVPVTDAQAAGLAVLEIAGRPTGSDSPLTEAYPAHVDLGRKTVGTSEFTLKIDPRNVGVMLRRKLDYAFPNQRAEVFIADADGKDWKPAGVWYLAGSNTCIYSNPKGELGAAVHTEETSNRRFRDDEFLLPRDLTAGRSSIQVQIRFTPTNIPLFPGRHLDEQAWSEIRYDAYSFILP